MMEVSIKAAREVVAQVKLSYGDDLTELSLTFLLHRLERILDRFNMLSVEMLLTRLRQGDVRFYADFLQLLWPRTTEMFRDPSFWRLLRDGIIPGLQHVGHPLRIWQAAFDSGEELYSLLVLLEELGIAESMVYSSYMGPHMLLGAQSGRLTAAGMKIDEDNYHRFNLEGDFHRYFEVSAEGGRRFTLPSLSSVRFVPQGLVFQPLEETVELILCRNQLLYFTSALSARDVRLLSSSLARGGVLGVGIRECLADSENTAIFTLVNGEERVYRRVG